MTYNRGRLVEFTGDTTGSGALFQNRVTARVATIALFHLFLATANAAVFHVDIIADENLALHHTFISQLRTYFTRDNRRNKVELHIHNERDWIASEGSDERLVVVLGTKAAQKVSDQKISAPVIYGLIPSSVYRLKIAASRVCRKNECSAVFLDQPFSRTINLARLALPDSRTIGLLTSKQSNLLIDKVRSTSKQYSLILQHRQLTDSRDLVSTLSDILKKSDLLLTLPDPGIFNSRTAQNILITAYRHRKPLLGYSKSFVKAGALLGVYSTLPQLAHQTAEMISVTANDKSKKLPATEYPKYYTVSVNYMVAKSLGINMVSESKLKYALEASENE